MFGDNLTEIDKARFYDEIEKLNTLKKIDLLFISTNTSNALLEDIEKDGFVIYEQARIENE